jgi:DNA-binding CsgD family transcriptional regulator/tetratricopeptide (TPR) repeat protein
VCLGRDTELAQLRQLLDDLDSSGGRVVLVRGEAGIGKSTLVSEFVSEAADNTHVLVGGCDDLLTPQPLGPFWDMARHEPSIRDPLVASDRPRLLEATLDLLSRSLRPTILVIEDTHWADEATLDVIKYLGRRIARTNGLLLLTYRDGEVDHDHPLRGVIGDLPPKSVLRIKLGGLSLSAVASIISGSTLDPDQVLTATSGNPFLITEMASADGEGIPASVEDSVMSRVGKLSIGTQEMLKTLSVIPEPIPKADALGLRGVNEERIDESVQRGLLEVGSELLSFRHDLIRRAIESAMSDSERLDRNRLVLEGLPAGMETTHSSLLIHCAVGANDVDRLLELAPRSGRYAASMESHVQAVEDYRRLGPYLDRLDPDVLGSILDEWAREEFLVDNVDAAIKLAEDAVEYYRDQGDTGGESGALARAAHYYENAGRRRDAETYAREAVDVLGPNADGAALARALEVNAYLHTMAGNVGVVPGLVDRILEAGGVDIDEGILIRALNHRGIVANIANYPDGRANLDEAWKRAEAAGQWYEESRALFNHAWAAAEFRDLPIALDYIQRSVASAVRHEQPMLEAYAQAMYSRILEIAGNWPKAEDKATDLLDGMPISQMVAMPIVGVIAARRGRDSASAMLVGAWEIALIANENQRLAPAAAALAEYAWITGDPDIAVDRFKSIMSDELDKGFRYSPGTIAFWLWKLGELAQAPAGIAEPYRLVIEGDPEEAATLWEAKGVPYERGLALMHGDQEAQLEALEIFETLGASAVAAKLRKALRDKGVAVPRGKGKQTRGHASGLTSRQSEVLDLLGEGLTNTDIADRLFLSHRTVENHVAAILMKLDVTGRDAAVDAARNQGLLPTR